MNYTSIEQSKKLLELGLNSDIADMYYHGHCSPLASERVFDKEPSIYPSNNPNWDYPCWSLGALLEVIPKEKELPFEDSNAFVGYGDSYYRCVYLNGNWESSHQEVGNSYIEAAYNMVVWLLENRYIKTENKNDRITGNHRN